jgi:hypothetical protein
LFADIEYEGVEVTLVHTAAVVVAIVGTCFDHWLGLPVVPGLLVLEDTGLVAPNYRTATELVGWLVFRVVKLDKEPFLVILDVEAYWVVLAGYFVRDDKDYVVLGVVYFPKRVFVSMAVFDTTVVLVLGAGCGKLGRAVADHMG